MQEAKANCSKKIKPKKITKNNFKKYGLIIKWQGKQKAKNNNQFRIVIREPNGIGWRIAYLIVRNKKSNKLEQHPFSYESFEPIKGKAILYCAQQTKPDKIEAFFLDQPVVLKKGIWHAVISISPESHIKITENNKVRLIYYNLGFSI
ncbi:MAG: ureidoglycolate lyase [Candidatus Omnitrophota bacterium]